MLEIFRIESKGFFELDAAHYLPTSGYSWNAMLRFTDVRLM